MNFRAFEKDFCTHVPLLNEFAKPQKSKSPLSLLQKPQHSPSSQLSSKDNNNIREPLFSDGSNQQMQQIKLTDQNSRFITLTFENQIGVKQGIRSLSHPVTCQTDQPLPSQHRPLVYFEAQVEHDDKDSLQIGIGLAWSKSKEEEANGGHEFPLTRACGCQNSIAVKAHGLVKCNDVDIHPASSQQQQVGAGSGSRKEYTLGIGYIRLQDLFWVTLNGKQIAEVNVADIPNSSCTAAAAGQEIESLSNRSLYPTFTVGHVRDKISVNFGQSQFKFNLRTKLNEYYRKIFSDIKTQKAIDGQQAFEYVKNYLKVNGYEETYKCLTNTHTHTLQAQNPLQSAIIGQQQSFLSVKRYRQFSF